MIQPRVIPTLLIQNRDLVKTKRFSKPRYLGDPINAIRIFNEKFADELCVLDITASKEKKEPDLMVVGKVDSDHSLEFVDMINLCKDFDLEFVNDLIQLSHPNINHYFE